MINPPVIVVEDFWPALIRGVELSGSFAPGARISHPPTDESEGRAGREDYFAATRAWLAGQDAAWAPLATTAGDQRIVHEGVLALRRAGGRVELPVALVADVAGGRITWLRIYHSMWPLEGKHTVRPPLLSESHGLMLSGAVAMYQDSLARGDLEGILAAFGPQAYAREPSGGPYVYRGPDGLRKFYAALFAEPGGIGLEHCTVTDDGVRTAIEYNAVRWGRTRLPPQAGVAVYERGADGLLAAARIYDDVDPPTNEE
jgi:hypothetical protein